MGANGYMDGVLMKGGPLGLSIMLAKNSWLFAIARISESWGEFSLASDREKEAEDMLIRQENRKALTEANQATEDARKRYYRWLESNPI